MGLLNWLWGNRNRPDPAFEQRRAQAAELSKKLEAYWRERGLRYELEKDDIPFFVIKPTRRDTKSLRELGELLHSWTAANKGVSQILGLERLLEGKGPEVSPRLLMVPYCLNEPESCVEQVALVVIKSSASTDALGASLLDTIKPSRAAEVWSCDEYSRWNR